MAAAAQNREVILLHHWLLIYRLLTFVLQAYCIDFSILKEKYHPRRDEGPSRIRTYCKDIERCTKARIRVDIPQRSDRVRRDVSFEIQGNSGAKQKAIEYIQGEFILRKVGYSPVYLITINTICTYLYLFFPGNAQCKPGSYANRCSPSTA